jgi:hypothetical protein
MENQTLETGELRNKNYPNGSDRRGFLKATATLGTAMCIPSVLTQSCTEQKNQLLMKRRRIRECLSLLSVARSALVTTAWKWPQLVSESWE